MVLPKLRSDVNLPSGYHSPQLDVAVRLNTNESPWAPPEGFLERLPDALTKIEWNRYPDRAASVLRSRIATGYGLGHDQVFAANGSNEVLQTLLLAYGGPRRKALVFTPTYALHTHISQTVGTQLVSIARDGNFEIDVDVACRAVDDEQPDIIFVCSPNNPTGTVADGALLSALLERADHAGTLVIVDEAYGQFAETSAVDLIRDDRPLVVSRTFSKTWSMAGLRLGYLLAPAGIVEDLERVVLPYHLDSFTQAAGTLALDFRDEMAERIALLVSERERVIAELDTLGFETWESGANFFLFRSPAMSGDDLWQRLVDESILVRNCSSWDALQNCLRMTVGTPAENDRFIKALAAIVNGLG